MKSFIDKKEIRRVANKKKLGINDEDQEDAEEVLSEWEGEAMSATEIEADLDASGESGSLAPNSSATTLTLNSADIEQTIEASQTKIGKFLLEESGKCWQKKAAALLDQRDSRTA